MAESTRPGNPQEDPRACGSRPASAAGRSAAARSQGRATHSFALSFTRSNCVNRSQLTNPPGDPLAKQRGSNYPHSGAPGRTQTGEGSAASGPCRLPVQQAGDTGDTGDKSRNPLSQLRFFVSTRPPATGGNWWQLVAPDAGARRRIHRGLSLASPRHRMLRERITRTPPPPAAPPPPPAGGFSPRRCRPGSKT